MKKNKTSNSRNNRNKTLTKAILKEIGPAYGKTPKYMNPAKIHQPDTVRKFTYRSDLTILSAGTTFLVKSFLVNSMFDPDPAILTTGYTGWQWWNIALDEYLVQISRAQWNVINLDATAISCFITYSFDRQDTTLTSWQQVRDAEENPFSTAVKTIRAKDQFGSKAVLRSKIVMQDLTKRSAYQSSELYSGTTGASPPFPIYVNFCAYATDGSTNLSTGLLNDISLTPTVELYSIKTMSDIPPMPTITKSPLYVSIGKTTAFYPNACARSGSEQELKGCKRVSLV